MSSTFSNQTHFGLACIFFNDQLDLSIFYRLNLHMDLLKVDMNLQIYSQHKFSGCCGNMRTCRNYRCSQKTRKQRLHSFLQSSTLSHILQTLCITKTGKKKTQRKLQNSKLSYSIMKKNGGNSNKTDMEKETYFHGTSPTVLQ